MVHCTTGLFRTIERFIRLPGMPLVRIEWCFGRRTVQTVPASAVRDLHPNHLAMFMQRVGDIEKVEQIRW